MEVVKNASQATLKGIATVTSTLTHSISFVSSFFVNTKLIPAITAAGFQLGAESIMSFLILEEILMLSSCSKFTSNNMHISIPRMESLIATNSRISSKLGPYQLSIANTVSLGNFRRILNTVLNSKKFIASIDMTTGQVILDAGCAYKDREQFLNSNTILHDNSERSRSTGTSSTTTVEDEEDEKILKHLEVLSFDEYDDFNPRHPNPRDMSKTHRRGGSYFNSDIESIAQEALADMSRLDLSTISSAALAMEGMAKPSGRISRVQSKLGITPMKVQKLGAASSDEEDDSKAEPNHSH